MKIIIDADACPKNVLKYTLDIGKKNFIKVVSVASFNHNIDSDLHIIVGNASQEADLKIINISESGDIIITQDWGLAAVVLSKNAAAISPSGIEYLADKMTFMLEEREMKAKFRREGGRTRGPSKRTDQDDIHYARTLEKVIQRLVNKYPANDQ